MNMLDSFEKASRKERKVLLAITNGGSWSRVGLLVRAFNGLAKRDHDGAELLFRYWGRKHKLRMRRPAKPKQTDLFADGNGDAGGRDAD